MVDFSLAANSPLDGYREGFDGTLLEEQADIAIVSIAVPLGGAAALEKAIDDIYGTSLPTVGKVNLSEDGKTRFLGMAPDQVFAIYNNESPGVADDIKLRLEGSGYVTLQSDNWVKLRISGLHSRAALARICPIDLDPSAFPPDGMARTVMEHMGTIILRDGPDGYLLLSASSSARSFVHAVETSIRYVT